MKLLRSIRAALLRLDRRQREDNYHVERSDESHRCPYCGEEFRGNFCPQCGNPPAPDDVTRRSALMNLFEIWNLGNTTVFRTMHHLLWRPGYMIGDWLDGRRSIYFPPVLMIIVASLLFSVAMNIRGVEFTPYTARYDVALDTVAVSLDDLADSIEEDNDMWAHKAFILRGLEYASMGASYFSQWRNEHYDYALMASNVLLVILLPLVFRHAPRHRRIRWLEAFLAQLYVTSGLMLLATLWVLIVGTIHDGGFTPTPGPYLLLLLYLIITYRQLFGYSLWGTTWRTLLLLFLNYAMPITAFIIVLIVFIVGAALV